MLGGFSLGLIVALAIYLTQRPPGSLDRTALVMPRPAEPEPAPVAPMPSSEAPAAAGPSFDRSGASGAADAAANDDADGGVDPETAAVATEFDFYDVLPEFEVVVPDTGQELRADPRAEARARSGNFVVQAGAFRTNQDADRMQARLALLGFESHVQRVAIDDDTYHRVRIGPVEDLGELNRIRRRLRDEGIDYLLIDTPE